MGPGTTLGDKAEQRALHFLIREGLKPVTRNFRSRGGEIDLIMLHGDCLTFVEVRYRSSTRFSSPAPTVDGYKQRKLLRTAAMFLASERHFARHTVRFDVVAIVGGVGGTIEWIQDAFRPNDSTL
ncbi:MAG: YraN family protein [Gammaproteobacteria bacterium]|nr:YraN family protein [Gammaproteobacteria bacterium]